jgi:hypothetical protein
MRNALDSLAAIPSDLRIEMSQARTADSVFVIFDIIAVDTAGTFTLHVAAVEDSNNIGNFGFENICRDMLGDGNGQVITLALGDSLHFTWKYKIPPGQYDLYTMIFVQNNSTKQILQSAIEEVQATTDVAGGPATLRVVLEPNTPNPFNPSTTIRFRTAEDAEVRLGVYDPAGRLIDELLAGRARAGSHEVVWGGTDREGRAVSSGLYFYRLETGRIALTGKMILLR